MPTGYTAGVADGDITSFPEFAVLCARAFGAAIMQRDDPLSAPLRLPSPSTDYSERRVEEFTERLKLLQSLLPHEVERMAAEAHREAWRTWSENEDALLIKRGRYLAMILKVEAWEPPTSDHFEMKEFMLSQLQESIRFDCRSLDHPTKISSEEWLQGEIAQAERDVKWHKVQIEEEFKRTNERRAWIQALADSLHLDVVDDAVVAHG